MSDEAILRGAAERWTGDVKHQNQRQMALVN